MKPGRTIAQNSNNQTKDWQIWFFAPVCLGLVLIVFEIVFASYSYTTGFNRGIYYLSHGNNFMAQIEFSQCIGSNPTDARSFLFRALANQKMGKNDSAVVDYTKAIELNPRNSLAYIGRAVSLQNLQQFQLAAASCNSALELDNSSLDAHRVRALALHFAGNAADSVKDCNYFLERHPQSDKQRAEALSIRAMDLQNGKNFGAAISDYTGSMFCWPNNGLLYLNRAVVYKEMKDYNKAIADCDSAEKRNTGELSLYSIRSSCYDRIGNPKAALLDLDHLAKISPTVETHRNRGRARLSLKDYKGALEDFEWILHTAPQDEEAGKKRDLALSAIKNGS